MIKCYHCSGKHELVSQVKDCSKIPAAFAAKVETGTIVETAIPQTVKLGSFVPAHRQDAKYLALKAQVAPAPAPAAAPALVVMKTIDQQIAEHGAALAVIKTGQDLELGMYQLGENIYKVHMNKYGTHKMASKLVIVQKQIWDDEIASWKWVPKGKFAYEKGMMTVLTSGHKMNADMAKDFHDATKLKYGQDYGFCCVCGKLLTVKKSIDAGIGPVCSSKL